MPLSSPARLPLPPTAPSSNGHDRPHPTVFTAKGKWADAPLRDQIAALHVTGLGPTLIVEELNCSRSFVYKIIRTLSAKACEAAQPVCNTPPEGDRRAQTAPAPTALKDASHAPAADPALTAFQDQVLALRRKGLTYKRIGKHLHCSTWKARAAVNRLPVDSRPANPLVAARHARDTNIVEMHSRGLASRAIASTVGCDRSTVSNILKRHAQTSRSSSSPTSPTAYADTPRPPRHSQLTPPSPDAIVDLRTQGLSIRQIAKRLGCSTTPVERTLTARKTWDSPHKRGHETSLVALAKTLLPSPPSGVAIALTADQLAWHLDALEGVVTQLIAIERAPDVFARMIATQTRMFRLPLSVRLGDFWAIARQLPDPIAFLDYDGMGALPADLQASLVALAPRFTSPCVIRLSCSMTHANSLKQLPQATQALGAIPGFQVTRLDVHDPL